MDLRLRHRVNELMDQPGLDEQLHRKALRGLRRVNWFSRSSRILWSAIRELAGRVERRPLRVLDIACGGGDVTVAIARRGQRAGIEMQVDGCDISPVAVRHARQQAEQVQPGVGFFELDALSDPLPGDYDVLMCSLFLHHLDEADAVELLRRMSVATRHLLLVNDLRRTRWGYWLARWGLSTPTDHSRCQPPLRPRRHCNWPGKPASITRHSRNTGHRGFSSAGDGDDPPPGHD